MNRLSKILILVVIVMSTVLTSCKDQSDDTQLQKVNVNEKAHANDMSVSDEKEPEQSSQNYKKDIESKEQQTDLLETSELSQTIDNYNNYLLFVNKNDDNTIYLLNKETKEYKQLFDGPIDYWNDHFMKLQKENYFVSDNKIYFLDGDTLKISLMKPIQHQVELVGNHILYIKDDNIYQQNLDDGKVKLLLENKSNLKVVHENNIIYIQVDDREDYYLRYIYKYNLETAELDEIHRMIIHDSNYYSGIRTTNNKDLYLQEDSKILKYDYEADQIIELEQKANDNKNASEDFYVYSSYDYSRDFLYIIHDNTYMKVAEFQNDGALDGVIFDDYLYLLTGKGNILKINQETMEIVDLLFDSNDSMNHNHEQENFIKIKENRIAYDNHIMSYFPQEEQTEDKINIPNKYLLGNSDDFTEFNNPYVIKDNKTYLESDINTIKGTIKEEYQDFTFSSEVVAYTRKEDNHLVIIDRKTKDRVYTSDFSVTNIKAYGEEVYYTRLDDEFGFYYCSKGKNVCIDKTMVYDYAVTEDNIYYSTLYPTKFYCKNKSTNTIKFTNNHVIFMVSESDTLYFVEGEFIYKKIDNKKGKEFIGVLPRIRLASYFYLHDNHIYSGESSNMCKLLYEFDKAYQKPEKIIYEDEDTLLYAVVGSLYVYNKNDKEIKNTINGFYQSNSTLSITKDAVYISNDDSIIYRLDLENLLMTEFYKSNIESGGLGDSLDFYVVNERYCVISHNNEATSHAGITIINTEKPEEKITIQAGKLLYTLDNKVYYADDDHLKYLDLTNGLHTDSKTINGSVTGYITTYKNKIIFENDGLGELMMVDHEDGSSQSISYDFSRFIKIHDGALYYCSLYDERIYNKIVRIDMPSLEKDVIGENFLRTVGITSISGQTIVLYEDNDGNLIRVDNNKTVLAKNIYSYEFKNNIVVFTKGDQYHNQIKDTVYCYDMEKDEMMEITLDNNKTNNCIIDYFINDDIITIRLDQPMGGIERLYYSTKGESL